MADNAVPKYKAYNPKSETCSMSAIINGLYRMDSFQKEYIIPGEIGKGYCRRQVVSPAIEIFVADITVCENITMGGKQESPHYGLAFCMGDPLLWWAEGNQRDYEIGCGESYIFDGNLGRSLCSYRAGKRFFGVNVQYVPDIIANLLSHMSSASTGLTYGSSPLYVKQFSPHIRPILNDIINCGYWGDIKKIYLEGKALELLAVYVGELIFENGNPDALSKFSPADIEALHLAKKILDGNIISPPTIGRLARMVCLNEYKIKVGFKELFGMPAHAYIIDKRMELARHFLRDRKLSVTETALLVGYNDTSHFAEKFRAKYGVNPSAYTRLS